MSVVVYVVVFHVSRLRIRLKDTVAVGYPVEYLLLVLEDAGGLVAPEVTYRMSVLRTIELGGVVVELTVAVGAVDYAVLSRNASYLILIIRRVEVQEVMEVLADVVLPSESNFYTGVLHVTAVDVRSARSCCAEDRSRDEPVLGFLAVPVEVDVELLHHPRVETDVKRLRCLPFQVGVCQPALVGAIVAALCSCSILVAEVVVYSLCSDRAEEHQVSDVLVTGLSPAAAELEVVDDLGHRSVPFFVTHYPSCTE